MIRDFAFSIEHFLYSLRTKTSIVVFFILIHHMLGDPLSIFVMLRDSRVSFSFSFSHAYCTTCVSGTPCVCSCHASCQALCLALVQSPLVLFLYYLVSIASYGHHYFLVLCFEAVFILTYSS